MQTQKTLFNPTVNGVPIVDYAMSQDDFFVTDPIDFMNDTSWSLQLGNGDFTYSIFMSNDAVNYYPYATLSQTVSNNAGDAPAITASVDVIGDKMFTDSHFPARYMFVGVTASLGGGSITLTICK